MGKIVEAAGILLMTRSSPQQILLLKHRNRWDLPKGHVEIGESILSAALRETEEETGISQHLIEIAPDFGYEVEYDVTHSKRGKYQKRVSYFLGFVPTQMQIQLTEHEGYRWIDWPVSGPIQTQTIDPLLAKVASYLAQEQKSQL